MLLVKMEHQVSLVALVPLVLLDLLARLDLLADLVRMDSPEALALRVKLELPDSLEVLAKMDVLALQALNPAQLDLRDLSVHPASTANLAKMGFLAGQVLQAKTVCPADLVFQVIKPISPFSQLIALIHLYFRRTWTTG